MNVFERAILDRAAKSVAQRMKKGGKYTSKWGGYFEVAGRKYIPPKFIEKQHGKVSAKLQKKPYNAGIKVSGDEVKSGWTTQNKRARKYKDFKIRSYTKEERFGKKGAGFLSFTAYLHPDYHAPSRELSPELFAKLVLPMYILNSKIKFSSDSEKTGSKRVKTVRSFLTQTLNMMSGFFKHLKSPKGKGKSKKEPFKKGSKTRDISRWASKVTEILGNTTDNIEQEIRKNEILDKDKDGDIKYTVKWIRENISRPMKNQIKLGEMKKNPLHISNWLTEKLENKEEKTENKEEKTA